MNFLGYHHGSQKLVMVMSWIWWLNASFWYHRSWFRYRAVCVELLVRQVSLKQDLLGVEGLEFVMRLGSIQLLLSSHRLE